ncbi:MAG: hypothetical protein KAX80_03450, partial [Planctomycetes bacterium]|nr:hypothetical protein [Planctomycetota bacterium]
TGEGPFIGTPLSAVTSGSAGMALNLGWWESATGNPRLTGVFRLGHERGMVRTLCAPRIVLSNGQMGYIEVTTEKDYIDTYDVENDILVPAAPTTVSYGVRLEVRPVVSHDRRYVFLELRPQVRSEPLFEKEEFTTFVGVPGGVNGGAAGAEVTNFITLLTSTEQRLETTVGVPDRGMLIVGGLTTSSGSHEEGGLPILDKIPFLKRLFSAETRESSRDTLFILVRPQIIILAEEEQRMD